jgi:hypothetical protein
MSPHLCDVVCTSLPSPPPVHLAQEGLQLLHLLLWDIWGAAVALSSAVGGAATAAARLLGCALACWLALLTLPLVPLLLLLLPRELFVLAVLQMQ